MLYLAKSLGYLDEVKFERLYDRCVEISKMSWGFIKSLKLKGGS